MESSPGASLGVEAHEERPADRQWEKMIQDHLAVSSSESLHPLEPLQVVSVVIQVFSHVAMPISVFIVISVLDVVARWAARLRVASRSSPWSCVALS